MGRVLLGMILLFLAVMGCGLVTDRFALPWVSISSRGQVAAQVSPVPVVVTIAPSPTLSPSAVAASAVPATACNPSVGWVGYRIQAGDTLSKLAEQTSSSVADLQSANCLDNSNVIVVGQIIYLPRSPVKPATGSTGDGISEAPTVIFPTDSACHGAPPPRLHVDGLAFVTSGKLNTPRNGPGVSRPALAQLPNATELTVLGEPQCVGGLNWWQVHSNGVTGWIAEGQGATYWLVPVDSPASTN